MKVAIYTIVKNEEKNVKSYLENVSGADGVFILDTGSTDNTIQLLKEGGVNVHQKIYDNFRFDVAFNDSISYIPDDFDVLISLDLDERLNPNWKEIIKPILKNQKKFILYHPYVNSWKDKEKTIPATIYNRNKIHSKKGVQWIYPVFCQTKAMDNDTMDLIVDKILIYHYQEHKENRDSLYEDIVKRAIEEEPQIADHNFSYAEMLIGRKAYKDAIEQWKFFLNKTDMFSRQYNSIAQRRSLALINMAKCYNTSMRDPDFELELILKAASECPYYREVWCYLAQAWLNVNNGIQSVACIETAKRIINRQYSLVNEEWCWDDNILNKILNDAINLKR